VEEITTGTLINYCFHCGHAITKENRTTKHTNDGKAASTEVSKQIAKCSSCGVQGVKLVRGKIYYELCDKCEQLEDEGKITGS
jgi:ribosomal protein L37AE/L43A